MVSLSYIGRLPAAATDITNKLATTTILNAASVTTASVQATITGLTTCTVNTGTLQLQGGTYATKTAVDQLSALFALPRYYQSQDLLNVPSTARGAVTTTMLGTSGYYGVASLNSGGQIPTTQMPALGAGYIKGPYGTTNQYSGATNTTPVKIADWGPTGLQPANMSFKPLVYMTLKCNGVMAKPLVDVLITNSTTAPTSYAAAGTLIARGEGRSLWNDYAAMVVKPIPDSLNEGPASYPTTYNVWVSAWLYDGESYNSTSTNSVTVLDGDISSAALYLMRTAQ